MDETRQPAADVSAPAEPMPEVAPAPQVPAVAEARPAKAELRAGASVTPIIPRTIEEVGRIAKAVITAGLQPDSYKGNNPEEMISKVIIGIMKGSEVGLPPISALSTIAVINNRPVIWGDGAVALIQAKGLLERIVTKWSGGTEIVEGKEPVPNDFPADYKCTVEIYRRGFKEPFVGEFSVRDAIRAGLWGNTKRDPWMKYPKRMLFIRARAFAIRDGFADVLAGLSLREEIEDLGPEAPAKTDTSFLDSKPPPAIEHQAAASAAAPVAHPGAPQPVQTAATPPSTAPASEPPLPLGEPKPTRQKNRKKTDPAP